MKLAVLISIVALSIACNGSRRSGTDGAATSTGAHAQSSGSNASDAIGSGTVTLVGCLQMRNAPDVIGTAGSAPGDRTHVPPTGDVEAQRHGAGPTGPFVLGNAAVEANEGRPNSAGATASAGSSFELDGMPADAKASVNKRVRVTGRIEARPPATTGATGAATSVPTTAGATSTRDDIRANSTSVAGDSTTRRLTVETLQVVAQHCGPQ